MSCPAGSGARVWLDCDVDSWQQSVERGDNEGSWEGKVLSSAARVAAGPESQSHTSDGFLWPEAVAEMSFLPSFSQLRFAPPRLGRPRRPVGAVSQAAIQQLPFIASQGAGLHCLWGAIPGVGNKDG